MGGRLLMLGLLWVAFAGSAFAEPEDEAEDTPPPSFSLPMLEAPPREESGPLAKKPLPPRSQANDPAPIEDAQIGETPAGPTVGDPASAPPPTPADGSRVKSYVDGLMSGLIAAGEFPGATIVVIQDGKVAFKSGYGFADVKSGLRVDPDRTLFRVASISKLITATAVMQVAEQGKVDLNADVNTYLTAFKIAPNYPEPVTLAGILTHTAGFDDRYLGLSTALTNAGEPLGQYLARTMPPRVMAPGKTFAYSNHALALAGHVVENASGQEFSAYVREFIFAPLGMDHSTFGVPYPLPQDMAVPYFKGGPEGGFKRTELDRVLPGPAGDLLTTAGDMAKFMLVHLNGGIFGDEEKLLTPQSIERMHARHFTQAEGLDGWAYGFAEGRRNGVRWIGHDGSWLGFCAQLAMSPDTKSGFFVAYNADCHFSASASLRKALFDLVWPPRTEIAAEVNPNAEFKARSMAGTYMAVRRARSDFTVMAAGASQIKVAALGEGRFSLQWPDGRELTFVPQANGTWINPDHQMRAAAIADERGQTMQLAIDSNVYDRVVGAGEWGVWSAALGFVVAVCVMVLWGWASGFLSRRLFGEPQAVITFLPRLVAFAAAGLTLATMVGMASLLSDPAPIAVFHGPTPGLMVLISVPVAIGLLTVPMIVWSIMGFGTSLRARVAQAGYAVLTIALLVFVAFAWQWGLHPFGLGG